DLGVLEDIEPQGIVTPSWQVFHLQSGRRVVFRMSAIADATRHPYRLQCEQYKLVKTLFERAAENDLVELRLGAEVTAVGQDESSAWAEAGGETFAGAYLVGSDGAHSVVRQ